MLTKGLSYKKLNEVLIDKINKFDINEQTILNSTNFINKQEQKDNGIFYTPKNIVNETHLLLNKLSKYWNTNYVVWDCAAGKGNLTKDLPFKNLYLSTLEETDIHFMNKMDINNEATKFQFDFLNDSLDKIPDELKNHFLKNDKIIFLINPPYAKNKNTNISNEMSSIYNHYTNSLTYIQFLYRIMEIKNKFNLTNVSICSITPLSFLTKESFVLFRDNFFNSFRLKSGFVFNSTEFEVKHGNWLVGTSLFVSGKRDNKTTFEYNIYKTNKRKIIYNVSAEEKLLKPQIKEKTSDIKETIIASSVKLETNLINTNIPINSIGSFINVNNNVNSNNFVYLLSVSGKKNIPHTYVTKDNIEDVATTFTVRKAILKTWLNSLDEYTKPKIKDKRKFNTFQKDSVIFSLFNNSSQQASYRNISNKKIDIANEWFWLKNKDVLNLTDNKNIIKDIKKQRKDRFISTYISKNIDKFSDETIRLIESVNSIYNLVLPDLDKYNLNYDSGWQQIKFIAKKQYPNQYKDWNTLYTKLETKLAKQIYEFGFLKNPTI